MGALLTKNILDESTEIDHINTTEEFVVVSRSQTQDDDENNEIDTSHTGSTQDDDDDDTTRNGSTQNDDNDEDEIDYQDCRGEYTREEIKDLKRKLKVWSEAYNAAKDLDVEFDTSEACMMKPDNYRSLDSDLRQKLEEVSKDCRFRRIIFQFSEPGEPWADGGQVSWGDWTTIQVDPKNGEPTRHGCCCRALEHYNDHINKPPKLKFVGLHQITSVGCFSPYYITFTALNEETGIAGTYQAATIVVDWITNASVFLVFLRHVEADKVLAFMDL